MSYAENVAPESQNEFVLSHHDIYWVKLNGSSVLVCRVGDLIEHARLDRFPKKEFKSKIDPTRISTIAQTLHELTKAKRPRAKMQIVEAIRSQWDEWFHQYEKLSVVEIILLSEQLVPEQMKQHADVWAKASMPLFHRSCYIATMTVMGASALGYASWNYLSELWKMAFSHSAMFALHGMGHTELPCLESVRVGKKESIPKLTTLESSYPSLHDVAKLVFERADGSGFPRGINVAEMNDVERWYAHLQMSVPWSQDFIGGDVSWHENFWIEDHFHVIQKLNHKNNNVKTNDEYLDFGL